jgi:hypothetical protein
MADTATLLERAGLITIGEDDEGRTTFLFTADGERVDRMRRMASGPDVDEVLDSLLGSRPSLGLSPVSRPLVRASIRRLM